MTKKKKKPYYPNNWDAIHECPAEWFGSIPFDEFMDWKLGGWEIPSSVACMIRETNLKTGKVKEYTYQRSSDAKRRARKIMDEAESEFIVCTSDEVHFVYPQTTNKGGEHYDPFD